MSILPPNFPDDKTKLLMEDLKQSHPLVWVVVVVLFLIVMTVSTILVIKQGHPLYQPASPAPSGPNPLPQGSFNPLGSP